TPQLQAWIAAYTNGADALPPEGTTPIHYMLEDPLGANPLSNPLGESDVGNMAFLDFSGNGGGVREGKGRLDGELAESQGIDCSDAAPPISIGDILESPEGQSGQQGSEIP